MSQWKRNFRRQIAQKQNNLVNQNKPFETQTVHGSTMQFGVLVHNWRKGWKWFSNVAFAGIVAVQTFYDTLPPELIATLPADAQSKITLGLAVLGLIGRFINQTKPKPLPPASETIKEDA
ncbi:hypothetical protein [Acinetobacter nosocomialis]|uniref:DUF7940 domain-containing protein n=1 Tax=Acinetobacter nosocomialis TaxID=106654 RepID=UPI000E6AD29E|nr:hypothetical protein [Acinetobacter nosocomialis]